MMDGEGRILCSALPHVQAGADYSASSIFPWPRPRPSAWPPGWPGPASR
ncbi:hypothetical protein ACFQU7_20925 [Pseudoroseomonas wenyumeiae]